MCKKKELKKLYKRLEKEYMQLQEDYEDAREYLNAYSQEHRRQEEELRYQHDYISWKGLDEEFDLFRKYAHEEEDSDNPFPHYVM